MKNNIYGTYNNKKINLYVIKDGDLEVGILNIGARIQYIKVKGVDITLGFNDIESYLESNCFAGSTIGRCGNRIANGKFTLNGHQYNVVCNEGKNHLHGGAVGFDKQFFKVKRDINELKLTLNSLDGDQGYSGNLKFTVIYSLNNNCLSVVYKAISDKDTLFNPTNHTYFNLEGETSGDCLDNIVQIFADKYTLVDDELIPTGESADVTGTAFDFRKPKTIRKDITDELLKLTNGYDHNFVLNSDYAAHVESDKTGIKLDLYTDMPCMQLYTGGALKPCIGKTRYYGQWAGFCLEPQYCPNAINMENEVKPILKAGQAVTHYIRYEFK